MSIQDRACPGQIECWKICMGVEVIPHHWRGDGIDFVEKFRQVIPKSMPKPYIPEEFYGYDTIVFRINNTLQEFRYSDDEIRRESRIQFGIGDLPEG